MSVACCYAGRLEEGERVVRPLRAFHSPVLDLCRPKPYLAHQAMFDASCPHGRWYYFRACDVAELSNDVIDVMVEHGKRIASPITTVAFFQMGGAVARVGSPRPPSTAALPGSRSTSAATARVRRVRRRAGVGTRAFWSALEPYHTSVYVNFLMEEGQERISRPSVPRSTSASRPLSSTYDPTNLFRLNQNIPPDSP